MSTNRRVRTERSGSGTSIRTERSGSGTSSGTERSGSGTSVRTGPWVFSTRELGRRPGNSRSYHRTVSAPPDEARLGIEVVSVPAGSPVELDVRLEAVTEGVYLSGSVSAALTGECARCLDELSDEVSVDLSELFAYPASTTDETTDADELPRVVDEQIDVEQTVRDAVVLALPLAPLCSEECPGLCPECGGRRAELGPDHRHETLDPRWAALRERLSAD